MFQKLANFENKIKAKIATRKARKKALKEAKSNYETLRQQIKESTNPADFLGDNIKSSDKVPEVSATTKLEQVAEKFGNKIIFKSNKRNGNYHADKGVIDGKFIEVAKTTKLLVVSTIGSKTRVFVNEPTPLKKSQVQKFMQKRGFDVEFA